MLYSDHRHIIRPERRLSESLQILFTLMLLVVFAGCSEGGGRSRYSGNVYGGPSPAKGAPRQKSNPLLPTTDGKNQPATDPADQKVTDGQGLKRADAQVLPAIDPSSKNQTPVSLQEKPDTDTDIAAHAPLTVDDVQTDSGKDSEAPKAKTKKTTSTNPPLVAAKPTTSDEGTATDPTTEPTAEDCAALSKGDATAAAEKLTKACHKKIAIECAKKDPAGMLACLIKAESLNQALSAKTLGESLLQEYRNFRQDPNYDEAFEAQLSKLTMARLYQLPSNTPSQAQNDEILTVAEHTIRALEAYHEQKAYYLPNKETGAPFISDSDLFMKYVIAFHDIGKGLAIKSGQKSREEIFSDLIAKHLFEALGFKTEAVNLGVALVHRHQVIGQGLIGREISHTGESLAFSTTAAIHAIQDGATQSGVSAAVFYKYLLLLHVADASSYEDLRAAVFKDVNGKLVPNSPNFAEINKF
jgi:hypothetical protein